MHEYSIVQALYAKVREQADAHGAAAVQRVGVRIGELSGVDVGLLETAWQMFRERTVCEHAVLAVAVVPAEWECRLCGTDVPPGGELRCPRCAAPARLRRGDDIVLEQVEMEVA